jgi:hypothetical protein
MINEYWKFLAYEKQGTIVTIWYQGDPLSFGLADPSLNPKERETIRAKLARFQECMQDALAHLQAALGSDESLIQHAMNLLGTGANAKDILWTVITMGIAFAKISGYGKGIETSGRGVPGGRRNLGGMELSP